VIPFAELRDYRELIYFFVWRDIKVRYKQTAIGAAWAVLQPFLTVLIFSLFFGRLAHIPSEGLPYPIFYYSALLPWTYFAAALQSSTNTIVDNQRLVTKVYFPRLALPLSSVLSNLIDFASLVNNEIGPGPMPITVILAIFLQPCVSCRGTYPSRSLQALHETAALEKPGCSHHRVSALGQEIICLTRETSALGRGQNSAPERPYFTKQPRLG
jgi:hypothetical protein